LTIAETYSFTGTDCIYDITVLQTIEVGGTAYYAPPAILSSESNPIPVTFEYASLTLTKLASVGPTVLFVYFLVGVELIGG
jgi:hypothetical protein